MTIDRLRASLADRYTIERELGAGGMATVWLAHDLKHDRQVAIKVLKPELAAVLGAERFVVEIKTTAALQHPHILPLFDSGSADGFLFYVMPYIQGETLRDKLNRETQLGVNDAVQIAREVLDALQYAHEHGIVHRDIKPENILLHGGHAMVADFGIALAVSAAAGGRMTETGLSLGTPHYMSPEQATADKEITGRSDIYSLGSVLFEMLTGNPPHTGSSAQQIIMKIIAEPVEAVTKYRKSVPPNVAAAVAKSLEKLPADRFDTAKAFSEALTNPGFRTEAFVGQAGFRPGGRRSALTAVLSVLVVALLATTLWGWRHRSPQLPVTRASIDIGNIAVQTSGELLVSNDGSRFAITGTSGGPIYWRRADEATFRPVPGTEDAEFAAFSPDGQSIAFGPNTGRILQRVDLSGGAPETVATTERGVGGMDWGDDGTIVYAASGGHGLYRVPASGGKPETILDERVVVRNPRMLPGAKRVLFTSLTDGVPSTEMVDLASHAVRPVHIDALDATFLASGYLMYVDSAGTLWAARFDPARGRIEGEPFSVLDGVSVFSMYAHFAVSQSGTLVFGTGRSGRGTRQLLTVTLNGAEQVLPLAPRPLAGVQWSPDGRTVAFSAYEKTETISVLTYDVVVGTVPRQVTDSGFAMQPAWSPDGKRLAFTSVNVASAATSLVVENLGNGPAKRILLADSSSVVAWDWPSADTLVVRRGKPAAIWIVDLSADSVRATPYLAAEADLLDAKVAPAHDFLAYESDSTIWVRQFPVAGAPTRVSGGLGVSPRWSPDGRTVYYWSPPDKRDAQNTWTLVAARLRRAPSLAVTRTDSIFRSPGPVDWDLNPDGSRFILARPVMDSGASAGGNGERFVVITNLLEELGGHAR